MKLNIVILAAGLGTRMKSNLPKVLHEIGGKPLIYHVLDSTKTLNPDKIIVIGGHGKETLQDCLSAEKITWVEQKELLGTGHALQQALPFLDDDAKTLILCGDIPLIQSQTLLPLIQNDSISWLTAQLQDPTGFGRILRDENGAPKAIKEEKDAKAKEKKVQEINTGICAFPVEWLKKALPNLSNHNAQKEYYLTDLFEMAIKEQKTLEIFNAPDFIETMGVNDKSQLAFLERAYQKRIAEKLMKAGLILRDPHRFDLRGELQFGQDCVIDCNVIIEGKVTLGNRCHIGANVILKDCTLGDDTIIKPNTLIESTTAENACEIGPFARVRPGTVLHDKAKLGNFVETKKTIVGKGSKINHLSYIGDAILGKKVNVGAGTITCNYDGINKFQTKIGDEAFIGSNSALVAPLTIGEKATIGAGSTLTQNAPDNQLTLARSKAVTIPHWVRPIDRNNEKE